MDRALTILAALALLGPIASASTVRFTCRSDGGGGVILSYTVTAGDGETIKDVHVHSKDGDKVAGTPQDHDNNTPGNTADDWTSGKGNGRYHWKTNGPGIPAGNSLTFTVTVANTNCDAIQREATWVTTRNGGTSYKRGDIVDQFDPENDPPIKVATTQEGVSVALLAVATIGRMTPIAVVAPQHPGELYIIAASFGTQPGMQLYNRTIPLNPDPLFWLSLQPNPMMQGFFGSLPLAGTNRAYLHLPSERGLVGLEFFLAGMTISPMRPIPLTGVSDAEPVAVSD